MDRQVLEQEHWLSHKVKKMRPGVSEGCDLLSDTLGAHYPRQFLESFGGRCGRIEVLSPRPEASASPV